MTVYRSRALLDEYNTSISTIMATAQIINCLVCMEPVRPRQQGVQCDGCFRWSQPDHPRVKCYIIPVFLMWPSHGKLKLTNSCCRLPCEGRLNKLPQLSLFLGPTQFTFLFSTNKLCMKVDLVSFECCGCGGLGIFRFNGVSHEGQFCY